MVQFIRAFRACDNSGRDALLQNRTILEWSMSEKFYNLRKTKGRMITFSNWHGLFRCRPGLMSEIDLLHQPSSLMIVGLKVFMLSNPIGRVYFVDNCE